MINIMIFFIFLYDLAMFPVKALHITQKKNVQLKTPFKTTEKFNLAHLSM